MIYGVYLDTLYSSPQKSDPKSREGVVRGILYAHTVHTYITYIAIKPLIEVSYDLYQERLTILSYPLLELLLHLSIIPSGTSLFSPLFGRQVMSAILYIN